MDEIFKPLLSGTTPSPPKFNVNVTWSALTPMDEKHQTPNITFGNTRAETLRFGGAGVQHSACCRVWIFCTSTVSLSDVFTSCGLQTLCSISITLHSADLILNCAKHWLFTSKCLLSVSRAIFFYSIIRNLFLSAQKTLFFSRASATFVLPIPFFSGPIP